jgi:hypothetical protein
MTDGAEQGRPLPRTWHDQGSGVEHHHRDGCHHRDGYHRRRDYSRQLEDLEPGLRECESCCAGMVNVEFEVEVEEEPRRGQRHDSEMEEAGNSWSYG